MFDLAHVPRFAIRQVGATWTVYNWSDLEPVRIGNIAQIGLDRDAATGIADRLNLDVLRQRGQRAEGTVSLVTLRGPMVRAGSEAA